MTFQYERDDDARRIVVRFTGEFDQAELLAILARHRTENVGRYGVLYDLRGLTGHPTTEGMRDFINREAINIATEGPRGPIAFLATHPVTYRVACTCAALGRPLLAIEVFRDRSDADSWLAVHAVKQQGPTP